MTPEPHESGVRFSGRAAWWLGLAFVLIVSIGFMSAFIDRGWIPHDEGTLGQGAERVLAGELPHRDFVEGYTGGLNYINALAFRVFGVRLLAIRYALFVAFVAWVPVFYFVATRMLAPVAASAVTLIAVFWSVPNYPAGMPSWYNLFLATAGIGALLKYIDSGTLRWAFVAGVLGGCSVLMKTHGLLFVAAGLLFLLYHEAQVALNTHDNRARGIVSKVFAGSVLACAVVATLAISFARRTWLDVYQFGVPCMVMITLAARSVLREKNLSATAPGFTRAALPYLLGAAIPILSFGALYSAAGALPSLVRDILLVSTKEGASLTPPLPLGLIPLAVVFFLAFHFQGKWKHLVILQSALGVGLIVLTAVPRTALLFEPLVWASIAESTPVAMLLLAIVTVGSEARQQHSIVQSRAVLFGCVAAFCSLIQYPFAAHVYFSYSFPLLLLAVVAVVQQSQWFRIRAVQGLTGFFLAFGALYITPMKLPGLLGPVARQDIAVLDMPRGGLRITRSDAQTYPEAVRLVQARASSGFIYAGPDAPEFYFLSGLKNPTPVFFDYQHPDSLFHDHLLQTFDSLGVSAVALRRHVVHSPPLEPRIANLLANRFPFTRDVGRFTIRWRQ